jgi:hypothetical protein
MLPRVSLLGRQVLAVCRAGSAGWCGYSAEEGLVGDKVLSKGFY